MNNSLSKYLLQISMILLFVMISAVEGNSRVAFTRPGSLMRTPFPSDRETFNQYIVGFGMETTHLSELNYSSASYFQGSTPSGYHFGITYNKGPEYLQEGIASSASSIPSYMSFHFHKSIFKRNNIEVSIGVHDMLYTAKYPHRVSAFALFSYNKKIKNDYFLSSAFGFGTGNLAQDSHQYTNSNINSSNTFFLGLKLKTPAMKKNGGLDILLEYDGDGINLGTALPINKAWTINLGITHFENISKFGDWEENNSLLLPDAPALAIGFQMNIPKLKYKKVSTSVENLSNIYSQMPYDESLDSLIRQATIIITNLEDSLMLQNQEYTTLEITKNELEQKINFLEDSLGLSVLDNKIAEVNLNRAMKHLSASLNAYYASEYELALVETERAIEIFPNLAIAYARKGSIYYRLGDIKRATINWNIALSHDPEYDEVRDALQQVKDNNNLNSIQLPE